MVIVLENYGITFNVCAANRDGEPPHSERESHAAWCARKADELNDLLLAQPKGTPKSFLRIEKEGPKRIRVESNSHGWTLSAILQKGTTPQQFMASFDDFVRPLGWVVVK